MNSPLDNFKININRVRELGAIFDSISALTTAAIDYSDILRAQVVLIVSSLDFYVHELVRKEMINEFNGQRPKTDSYLRFQLSMDSLHQGLIGTSPEIWLDDAIRVRHSWQSFQDPDKIAEAIRLISDVTLWESVGIELNMSAADVKIRLKLIVDRRNKIAHEADSDPTNPSFRWPIDKNMVNDTLNFIEQICDATYRVTR